MPLRGLQFCLIVLVGSLFALTGLRQLFVEPLPKTAWNLAWFAVQVLPLALILPGILTLKSLTVDERHYRRLLLVAMVAMLYFIHGVMLAATPELRAFGSWEIGVSLLLIATSTVAARQRNQKPGPDR